MNETMKTKMQDSLRDYLDSLRDYLTIFESFGNCGLEDCGLDGNYYGYNYPFTTTSEPRLRFYIGSDYIELYNYGSGQTISCCDYRALLKGYEL